MKILQTLASVELTLTKRERKRFSITGRKGY
ncbi:hypothetical protein IX296_000135 [Bacteroides pyogenes]|nr:hypothetical protein [Bacteroides pyogenes]MBR8737368.1 hypothetical protein [Bacteroides pyogenes]MBR8752889.1 hypothetical protein [Bacteroides pyogenes]MBR8794280.1 hypothetical protein [Bacteroides pyogenes]MBR8807878.1 hypothetical protein [Bacteroides pyogenes]